MSAGQVSAQVGGARQDYRVSEPDLRSVVMRNRAGEPIAAPSVCSAQPDVLVASALLAASRGVPLLVEATSNQVNQFGGYTGMQPADFVGFVHRICDRAGLQRDQLILGGDHLGPQAWRDEDATTAMVKAGELVRSFVQAGFTKIHLDCSEGCRGEPAQLADNVIAERSARLARVCEENAREDNELLYVVGTEVPPPGGARLEEAGQPVIPTSAASALATLAAQKSSFMDIGLDEAWTRVIGLVVQPGLEFGATEIHHFDMSSPNRLSPILDDYPQMAFEAHSTDYQNPEVFPLLACRHFAILKVGPALTFAYRQAVYALDHLACWCGLDKEGSLAETIEGLMLASPGYWARHYSGSDDEVHRLRHFSYADRIRYYWNQPQAAARIQAAKNCLAGQRLSAPLLLQYFPASVIERAHGLTSDAIGIPQALIYAQIQEALLPYFRSGFQ